ncbi:THAP domain-containing protein 6-like [Pempheris klunzingeri]|uniref:THAP domain-containing protein 6-like n=1 Tax=Pempheris klunzingeri TaxID=3127111 RepID=UPI00397FE93C
MPCFCAAIGCSNQRNAKTKEQGITFHRFPKDKVKRRAWAVALRRREFEPSDRSVICSRHFKDEDFDRTGQTTRLREGVIPSVLTFPGKVSPSISQSAPRSSRTSLKAAAESPDVQVKPSGDFENSPSDHQYALDPDKVKRKLTEAQEKVEELQRELRNAKDRERRHKKTVKSLLEDLKHKNMLTEELKQELDLYSDLPV